MWLIIDGASIGVTHMGPDFLLLEAPVDHPPGGASVVLQVDQTVRRWDVHLPNGIRADSNRVSIAPSL